MPTDRRIDYVEFPASDLETIEAFYGTAFGWKFTPYGDDYRAFSDGQFDGGFFRSEQKSSTENGAALVVLYADNLEETCDRVAAQGGVIHREIFSFPGGRRFHFLDPNGNELGVWSDK